MTVNLGRIVISLDEVNTEAIVENWKWLVGNNKRPFIISSIGDLFLIDDIGNVYWLNTGEGTISFICESITKFWEELSDITQVNEWFMNHLVDELFNRGLYLSKGKLFSPIKLPILGGEYLPENYALMDIVEHFQFSGFIHNQIKDLPDGTNITFETVK